MQLQINHSSDSDLYKSPCREICLKPIHPATNKSPCTEFSYKQLSHPVESSARNKSPVERSARISPLVDSSPTKKPPCREFSYKQITLQESSVTNKSPSREFSYKISHPVESSATHLREQLEQSDPVERSTRNNLPCREVRVTL